MAIFHFKHSYLDWRVNPCKRRNDLCFCSCPSFFSIFSWFSFILDRIFQVHDMTIIFLFALFFFMVCLFRAMAHIIDGLPAWSIFPYVKIVLKGLAFWSKVFFRSFPSKERIIAQKYFRKMGNFRSMCPKILIMVILGYHDLGILFCSWKRFGRFETVASLDACQITKISFFF